MIVEFKDLRGEVLLRFDAAGDVRIPLPGEVLTLELVESEGQGWDYSKSTTETFEVSWVRSNFQVGIMKSGSQKGEAHLLNQTVSVVLSRR